MSDATQTPTLEQTLNKTDFGHVIYENRKVFFAAILAVIVVVCGYVGWKQYKTSAAINTSVKVFEFQKGPWEQAKTGKLGAPELFKAFEGLDKTAQTAPVMVPVGLEVGKFLFEKGALDEANSVLSKLNTESPITAFFIGMQRSVILEKQNKLDEAISVLDSLGKNKDALMSAKVSLELGRLSLAKNDTAKARTHFEYVLNTYPNDDYAKLAKLYLAKITQ